MATADTTVEEAATGCAPDRGQILEELGRVGQELQLAQAALGGSMGGVGVMATAEPIEPPEPPEPPAVYALPDLDNIVGGAMAQVQTALGGGYGGGMGGYGIGGSGGGVPTTPLIIAADLDSGAQSEIHEDLSVMSRILAKAVNKASGEVKNRIALGINVQLPFGQPRPASLYLEDFGAVFLLQVNYPMVAPPSREDAEAPAEKPSDTTWEDARAELYGDNRAKRSTGVVPPGGRASGQAEYDASRVDALKTALLEAARNVSNIRHLKPEERIVIVVQGPGQPAAKSAHNRFLQRYGLHDLSASSLAAGPTLLTLRFKKADGDAVARGEISLDEFGKRAAFWTH